MSPQTYKKFDLINADFIKFFRFEKSSPRTDGLGALESSIVNVFNSIHQLIGVSDLCRRNRKY